MKKLFSGIFNGWSLFEKLWLVIFTAIIIATGIMFDDTVMGMTASITGVLCVILVAKGKISNYFFGVINTVLYAYISYNSHLFGETMLNTFFYLPIQFIGFYMWKNNQVKTEIETVVKANKLTKKGWINLAGLTAVVGVLYAIFLHLIGSQQAGVDAFAVIISITAQLLMLKRYAEQWLLWIVVNILSIILWLNVFIHSGNSVTILVMWIAYLINAVYGYVKWIKLAKEQEML